MSDNKQLADDDKHLLDMLNSYSVAALQTMGKALGLSSKAQRVRNQLVTAIAEQMDSPEAVQAVFERLPSPDREVLRLLQAAGGQTSPQTLRALALHEGLTDPEPLQLDVIGKQKPLPPNGLTEVVKRLQEQGMVLSPGHPQSSKSVLEVGLRETLLIPAPVLRHLPPLPPPDVAFTADTALMTVLPGEASPLQRDLYLYWSAVRDNEVSLTTRGLVNKTHLKRINATLTHSEDMQRVRDENQTGWLQFLRHILTYTKLVRADTALRRLDVLPTTEAFFTRPLAERSRAALDAYRASSTWNELARIPRLLIQNYREGDHIPNFILQARETVLHLLASFPHDGWLDLGRILDHLRRSHYDFLLSRQPYRRSYMYSYTYSSAHVARSINPYRAYEGASGWTFSTTTQHLDESNGWEVVEAGFVEAMLREPLHWLGLFDLGTVPDDNARWGNRLVAIRLTPLGAHLLADAPLPEDIEPTGGRLIVQPTFEVLAYPPVSETHLALLDRVAERAQLDQVAVYRLTREALYQAHEQHGLSVAEVIAALERESGTELPQNVAYSLHEWGRAQERVTLHEGLLLIQADAALLDRLETYQPTTYRPGNKEPQPPGLVVRRLTPTAALLRPEAGDEAEKALFDLGSLPVVYSSSQVRRALDELDHLPPHHMTPRPWLTVAADGQIGFRVGAPHPFLRQRLRPFTVEEGAGVRLTEAQVQQAVKDGLPLENLLGMLRAWNDGTLPAALEQALKGWGNYYGSVALERPLVLRLSDQRTLEALLSDPEVGRLVQRYQPQGMLAQVRPADLERVRALLAARGIALDESGE